MISFGQRLLDRAEKAEAALKKAEEWKELCAIRRTDLHVLCHEMLSALEELDAPPEMIHRYRERLHDVPQCRRPEHPLRRGY